MQKTLIFIIPSLIVATQTLGNPKVAAKRPLVIRPHNQEIVKRNEKFKNSKVENFLKSFRPGAPICNSPFKVIKCGKDRCEVERIDGKRANTVDQCANDNGMPIIGGNDEKEKEDISSLDFNCGNGFQLSCSCEDKGKIECEAMAK